MITGGMRSEVKERVFVAMVRNCSLSCGMSLPDSDDESWYCPSAEGRPPPYTAIEIELADGRRGAGVLLDSGKWWLRTLNAEVETAAVARWRRFRRLHDAS
jgi:hypothetical protein